MAVEPWRAGIFSQSAETGDDEVGLRSRKNASILAPAQKARGELTHALSRCVKRRPARPPVALQAGFGALSIRFVLEVRTCRVIAGHGDRT